MYIKIFTIPITDSGQAQEELNGFLSSNKILEIGQQFYQNDKGAVWCFCIRYLQSKNASKTNFKQKIDYKEILNEHEFSVFSELRIIRKALAEKDAVPAYAVFTDAELAEMSKIETLTTQAVKGIKGIAEKRMEKYGNEIISIYLNNQSKNETTQPFN